MTDDTPTSPVPEAALGRRRGPQLSPLTDDQQLAWTAIRARLVITYPWLTTAIFTAVPVALTPGQQGDEQAPTAVPPVSCDRWGRIYVDFTLEARSGIRVLADAVQSAALTWVSEQAPAVPWHASRLDDRFPAVGAADTERAGRATAAGIIATPAGYGDPLSGWRQWARNIAGPPQVPWEEQLAGHLRGAVAAASGHTSRTYARPGRRQLPDIITPARRGPHLRVAVIADISGSIDRDLPTVLAEVERVTAAAGLSAGTVTLYAVDDEVAATHRLPAPDLHLEPRGGHLTDLRAGFDAVAATPRPVDVIVTLTDGITPWPQSPPRAAVIVALIGPRTVTDKSAGGVPTWADVVRIDTEGAAG